MRLYAKKFFRIDETTMQKRITDDSEPPKAESPLSPKAPSGEMWKCKCGREAVGKFCPECGGLKPSLKFIYECHRCGFKTFPSEVPPRFCSRCGSPMGAER